MPALPPLEQVWLAGTSYGQKIVIRGSMTVSHSGPGYSKVLTFTSACSLRCRAPSPPHAQQHEMAAQCRGMCHHAVSNCIIESRTHASHARALARTHAYTHVRHALARAHIHMHLHKHKHTHTHKNANTNTNTYKNKYTKQTRTPTRAHTRTQTQAQRSLQLCLHTGAWLPPAAIQSQLHTPMLLTIAE